MRLVYDGFVDAIEADYFGGEVSIYLEQCRHPGESPEWQGKRVRVTIEPADAPDPILAWLVREAAEAWRVLEAEQDPGNIKTMRQWVHIHECLVRLRLDEMGLLDVDDEPAGGERQ
jgi:hypothetical protein